MRSIKLYIVLVGISLNMKTNVKSNNVIFLADNSNFQQWVFPKVSKKVKPRMHANTLGFISYQFV